MLYLARDACEKAIKCLRAPSRSAENCRNKYFLIIHSYIVKIELLVILLKYMCKLICRKQKDDFISQ